MLVGGVKVDAFIYSPLLPASTRGSIYSGLMHVTDWFPTMLALAGLEESPYLSEFPLDGMNQYPAWIGEAASSPRSHILYNWYTNVSDIWFDPWVNGSFAVRNDRCTELSLYHLATYNE